MWHSPVRLTYLSGADIAGADNVLHFAGHEQLLELVGQRGRPLRNVNVSNDQDELAYTVHRHFLLLTYFLFLCLCVKNIFIFTEFNYNKSYFAQTLFFICKSLSL